MTKTPEELTEEWKARKLKTGWYYVVLSNGFIDLARLSKYGHFYHLSYSLEVEKPISIVPTYDEYKAMQAELDEFKRTVTSYVGKPIDYDIACKTVNKLLDDKKKLKKELAEHRENCCCLENERLRLDKAKLEEEIKEKEELIQSIGSYIEELDIKKSVLIAENNKLRGLLKECKNIVAHDCWQEAQFPDGQVVQRQDLLTRINAALGESEE